ncbi:hypothetical protein SLEP1_g29728 [Rubroshorea leprosula]|uniref:Uncharacterized protein n=1 Tax=Rubroshorea leprosula TaxID=152421 RepID=A0AAV5K3Z7_9ROSI|nr:hypothetical protein SLEP1_g29728 [Rubroshorea leprosula]
MWNCGLGSISFARLSFNTLTVCDVIMIQVDTHIQQLDQYLKRFDEELRRERENAAAAAVLPTTSLDGSAKSGSSEGGRGGRKKYALILDILIDAGA